MNPVNAKLRSVNTKFWDDQYIVNLDPTEKLLFLYFLTCPLTNLAGVYEVGLRRAAFDTGIDKDMVQKIIDRFSEDNKIHYFEGFVILVNYQKNQKYKGKMLTNVHNTIAQLPEPVREFYKNVVKQEGNTLSIGYREVEEEIEKENKGEVEKIPPALGVVSSFFQSQKQSESEAVKFLNHYNSIGWKKSGQRITDWQAAALSWIDKVGNFSQVNGHGKSNGHYPETITRDEMMERFNKGDKNIEDLYEKTLPRTKENNVWKLKQKMDS